MLDHYTLSSRITLINYDLFAFKYKNINYIISQNEQRDTE